MQQINLLNSLPKQKIAFIKVWHMVLIGIFACLLLILWWGSNYKKNQELKRKIDTLVLAQKNLTDQLLSLSKVAKTEEPEALRQQEQLIELLNSKQNISIQKFIKYLQLLADVTPDNLWLTQITAQNSTDVLNIQGEAYQVPAVLHYVNLLNQFDVFNKHPFSVVTLAESKTSEKAIAPVKIVFVIQMQEG